uniref:Multiple epidermal growth factor-like domains 10 n=1 Tax=Magallana gigas TaxID=29159 RepID=A0A8W8NU51_MAGGI
MLSLDQHINCSLQGRYVIYYNERKPGVVYPSFYSQYAYNELCEVEVYGCNGTFGDDCTYPCPTNCQDRSNGETCHHINGTCLHGCAEGTTGDTCQEGCQSGYYGRDCSHRCSESCIVTKHCDRVTGRCEVRATNTEPSSCTESYNIVIVVVSLLIVVTGSMINFVIWKRNAAWGICRNLQVKERKRIINIQNLKRLTNPRHMKKSIVIPTETGSNQHP